MKPMYRRRRSASIVGVVCQGGFTVLLWTVALLAGPTLTAVAQDWSTGVYASINGGAFMVSDAQDIAAEVTAAAALVKESLPSLGKDWKFGIGGGGAVGVGNDFGAIRLDGELSYLTSGISITRDGKLEEKTNKDSFTLLAVTGNTWFDIGTGTGWTLYLGGGFGAAHPAITLVDIKEVKEAPDYTFEAWSLAFQAGAGIGYHVADFMVIDLGYRLLGAVDPKLEKSSSIDEKRFTWTLTPGTLLTHRVGIGLRVIFL